jgi:hypothetical protein
MMLEPQKRKSVQIYELRLQIAGQQVAALIFSMNKLYDF